MSLLLANIVLLKFFIKNCDASKQTVIISLLNIGKKNLLIFGISLKFVYVNVVFSLKITVNIEVEK